MDDSTCVDVLAVMTFYVFVATIKVLRVLILVSILDLVRASALESHIVVGEVVVLDVFEEGDGLREPVRVLELTENKLV